MDTPATSTPIKYFKPFSVKGEEEEAPSTLRLADKAACQEDFHSSLVENNVFCMQYRSIALIMV